MNDKLLPCPFCGGEAAFIKLRDGIGIVSNVVQCQGCGALGALDAFDTGKAIAAWNTRTPNIVHCSDCQSYTKDAFGKMCCMVHFRGRTELMPHEPDDFCSKGVRKGYERRYKGERYRTSNSVL